jgi:hypothetical protein
MIHEIINELVPAFFSVRNFATMKKDRGKEPYKGCSGEILPHH